MHHLHKVYDVEHSFPNIQPMFFAGLVAFIFLYVYIDKRKSEDRQITWLRRMNKTNALVASIFAICAFALVSFTAIRIFFITYRLRDTHDTFIVEGYVEHYHPMYVDGGHGTERFDVKGVQFDLDDDTFNLGYNNAAHYGGAIKTNLYVRIEYCTYDDRNVILKLETE
jgi:hypothetical protein